MRLLFAAILIVLVSCASQLPDEKIEEPVLPEVQQPQQLAQAPVELCTPPPHLIVLEKTESHAIGLQHLTIVDKGGWYKITDATVYVNFPQWHLNDITFDIRRKQGSLDNFYTQQIPLAPNTTCGIIQVPLNINIKDLSGIHEVTVKLGYGQSRSGRTLVVATTEMNLAAYVE